MQVILEKILKGLTRAVLKKQKPQIVTITGSVGKTSTKEAVYLVLKSQFNVRRNIKNYNNEIGVPLTIIGSKSPGKNIFGWAMVFSKAVLLAFSKKKNYPQILVLEIGSDKPGDLKYLMEIFPKELLKAAVLTAVAPVHLEFFGTIENIWREKTVPFQYLSADGKAIVNKDCVKNYDGASIDYDITQADNQMLGQFIFRHHVYALLAAIKVGEVFKIKEVDAKEILRENYKILPGRGRRIKGINGSVLIDDTYNSSPLSARAAVRALANWPDANQRIAVLGDMLELGERSSQFHQELGKLVKELEIDYLITYGKEAEQISGNKHFQDQRAMIEFLKSLIKQGDVVLIKGSQGVRMEKIVKALMLEPERAAELLVRQNKEWLKKDI